MTCSSLLDWRLVQVVGGLICLGVSMSFMSIFDTARCLEGLSMPGPGLGHFNPWVKGGFPFHITPLPSILAVEMPCGNAKQLQQFHASSKTQRLASAQTLEISRRSRRRSDSSVARFLMLCYLPSWPTKTGGRGDCSRLFVCFAQRDLQYVFFFKCFINMVLYLYYCSLT